MKVNIKELIKELDEKYNPDLDSYSLIEIFKNRLDNDEKEFAVILGNTTLESEIQFSFLFPDEYRKKFESYYVAGIFELSRNVSPKYNGYTEYVLYIFSKNKPDELKICTAPREKTEFGKEIKTELKEYHKDLEDFINYSKISPNINSQSNIIPFNNFHKDQYNVHFYTKKFLAVQQKAKKQKNKPLKDLVEILIYSEDNVEFEWECIDSEIIITNTSEKNTVSKNPLINGDVVLEHRIYDEFNSYLISNETKHEIPLGMTGLILRIKSNLITPEYLYLYLESSFFKTLSTAIWLGRVDVDIETIADKISKIPVYLPNTDTPLALNKELSKKYRDIYYKTYRHDLIKKTQDYFTDLKRPDKTIVKEDALLDELLDCCFKDPHKQKLLNYINVNMKELNVSIPNGAYRSAVVLIGSILEAFLTDWASELDGKNYFKEPYRELQIQGRTQRFDLSLNDAICHIAKIIKKWNAREKADAIRIMRNDIHPRVFLDNGKNLTKQECEMALKNLQAVIKSRYDDFSPTMN